MSRGTSSCWPRPGCPSAGGSWSRSPSPRPRTRSGSTGTGTRPPSPRPGSRDPGRAKQDRPRAENRWYACDITAGRDVTIGKVFAEADRRDPGHLRTWIALADGDNYQLGLIQAAAAARGITLAVVIDFIHVLEYLWKAAWCFHPPRDPAMEDWVTDQALDILHGRVPEVIARITRLAEDTRRNRAASTPRSSAKPCPTCRPSSPTWTTPAPWPKAGRSPPASSRAPAATWSPTGWASPAPAGACQAPRPCSG